MWCLIPYVFYAVCCFVFGVRCLVEGVGCLVFSLLACCFFCVCSRSVFSVWRSLLVVSFKRDVCCLLSFFFLLCLFVCCGCSLFLFVLLCVVLLFCCLLFVACWFVFIGCCLLVVVCRLT